MLKYYNVSHILYQEVAQYVILIMIYIIINVIKLYSIVKNIIVQVAPNANWDLIFLIRNAINKLKDVSNTMKMVVCYVMMITAILS